MNLQKIKNNLTNIGIGFILSAIFLKVVGVNGIFLPMFLVGVFIVGIHSIMISFKDGEVKGR